MPEFTFDLTPGALRLAGLAFFTLFTPLAATAQPVSSLAEQVLPQVVITAADIEQPLARTIGHTTLIDEAEIRRSGATDVTSLLRVDAPASTSPRTAAWAPPARSSCAVRRARRCWS